MTLFVWVKRYLSTNFNSHARVGRDYRFNNTGRFAAISTHTPAWGVTPDVNANIPKNTDFNSHARVGRDPFTFSFRTRLYISTHTPAWGVTCL